jgi:multimeric flavodoxin WrbA
VKLLAIHGSPRKRGFSSTLHREFIRKFTASQTDITEIHVYDKKILPCTACGTCRNEFYCPVNDDMENIYNIIRQADVISISTPLYFSSVPSQLKALIDRCQVFWEQKIHDPGSLPRRKQGVLFCTAGADYTGMFSGVLQLAGHFFKTINAAFTEEDCILLPGTDSYAEEKISLEIINLSARLSERIITGITR